MREADRGGEIWCCLQGGVQGKDAAIKKTKEVDVSGDTLDEFVKEVGMLDKSRRDFNGVWFIPNHIMTVTEFAPYEWLMECIRKRPEPDEPSASSSCSTLQRGLRTCTATGS